MITIFTPVYNRAYIINNLYQSLRRQTCKDFEWIVIDDGSQDNIIEIVNKWIKEDKNFFPIHFYSVKNGGKHRCINIAIKLAKGEAFFIVDSDDYITDDAIEWIGDKWKAIQDDAGFAGIAGLIMLKNGKLTGAGKLTFKEYVDATNLERSKYSLDGDKAEVYKTELLQKYPFPEYDNENFVTEAAVWNKIAYDGYKIRWFNKTIYICDYLEDGLSKNIQTVIESNPRGWARYLADCNIYEGWNRAQYIEACRHHYEKCFDRVSLNELACIWRLDSVETGEIDSFIKDKLDKIDFFMIKNNIVDFAIYGYGIWGRKFQRYLKDLGLKERFIIDKNVKFAKGCQIFSLNDDFPNVDNIIICVKNGIDEIKEEIYKKNVDVKIFAISEWGIF